ncbi:hypothetical protein F511_11651 [Dorcoceras hygrometricum]|uniref:Uncharacterized protein n=1 Tax=Dorcoceras hygrometricum TaxID=472368 RepID=A0A2Z7AK91_9LAMI|nr:hypothetical protein F511_11651 [Dorcoceras hygrometricum]
MPPKRREQTDKNKEVDSMPELEELPADEEHREMSVQNMVDRIEGHYHGHAIAKQPAESHEEIPEKNTVEMEGASKMMVEGILAYVKAVVSHITQSTTQGSFQHKGVEQGIGSSRAGETRRSIPTPQSLNERGATEDKDGKDSEDSSSEGDAHRNRTIVFHVGKFHISVDCNTGLVIFPEELKQCSDDKSKVVNHGDVGEDDSRCHLAANSALLARIEAQRAICDSADRELHRKYEQGDDLKLQNILFPDYQEPNEG